MPLPRTLLAVAVTATAAVATGCGSSSPAPAPASPTTTRSTTTISAGLSPRAQYAAVAGAINLRPGDVPGFIGHKKHDKSRASVNNKAFEGEPQYKRCFGVGHQTKPVFKAPSDSFNQQERLSYKSVSSSVEVMPTIATVQQELAAIRKALDSARARQCLTRVFDRLGKQSQPTHLNGGTMRVTLGGMRLVPISLGSVKGTDGGVGMSLSTKLTYLFTLHGHRLTVPTTMNIDSLAFAVGRAEVALTTTTIGPSFPPELEGRLFSLLVSRATAAAQRYPAIRQTAASSTS